MYILIISTPHDPIQLYIKATSYILTIKWLIKLYFTSVNAKPPIFSWLKKEEDEGRDRDRQSRCLQGSCKVLAICQCYIHMYYSLVYIILITQHINICQVCQLEYSGYHYIHLYMIKTWARILPILSQQSLEFNFLYMAGKLKLNTLHIACLVWIYTIIDSLNQDMLLFLI